VISILFSVESNEAIDANLECTIQEGLGKMRSLEQEFSKFRTSYCDEGNWTQKNLEHTDSRNFRRLFVYLLDKGEDSGRCCKIILSVYLEKDRKMTDQRYPGCMRSSRDARHFLQKVKKLNYNFHDINREDTQKNNQQNHGVATFSGCLEEMTLIYRTFVAFNNSGFM
jgi:hypothetical protein